MQLCGQQGLTSFSINDVVWQELHSNSNLKSASLQPMQAVLVVSLPPVLPSQRICMARHVAPLWQNTCRAGGRRTMVLVERRPQFLHRFIFRDIGGNLLSSNKARVRVSAHAVQSLVYTLQPMLSKC
jgi:hypothetical protein